MPQSLFNVRQDYSLQPRTLLNSITDDFIRMFWNSCTKNFERLSEKPMQRSSLLIDFHEYSLQPTTGLQYRYILEVLRNQRMFENFQNCLFFSNATALESRICDFIKYRLQGKCFLWVFWNSWKFDRERSIMKSFDYASKKISLYIFGRMLGKLLFIKV